MNKKLSLSPSEALPLSQAWSQLPSQPGVYWWLGAKQKILYVGKAKNLKNRLLTYKRKSGLPPRSQKMLSLATHLKWRVLPSELEALLVEADLINLYQPPFNVLLKDDKSHLYLIITQEEWPRVLKLRQRDWHRKKIAGQVFGPFPSAYKLNEVLKIVRSIFPWCNAPRRQKMKPCFEAQLDLCPGVCTGNIKHADYIFSLQQLSLFLQGKTKLVQKQLKKQLQEKIVQEDFEQAVIIRDKINLINEITSANYRLKPDLFLSSTPIVQKEQALLQLKQIWRQYHPLPREYQFQRLEGYDISHTTGQLAVASMVVCHRGVMESSLYRSFNLRKFTQADDYAMLAQALKRRQKHEPDWGRPDMLIIDGGKGQVRAVLKALSDTSWQNIPILGLVKNPDRLVIPVEIEIKQNKLESLQWQIIKLADHHPVLKLLQEIRDEAHRFGKKRHTKRREKQLLA